MAYLLWWHDQMLQQQQQQQHNRPPYHHQNKQQQQHQHSQQHQQWLRSSDVGDQASGSASEAGLRAEPGRASSATPAGWRFVWGVEYDVASSGHWGDFMEAVSSPGGGGNDTVAHADLLGTMARRPLFLPRNSDPCPVFVSTRTILFGA